MKPDYYAALGQKTYPQGFEGIDFDDIDAVTTRYHILTATGHKDDRDTGGNSLRGEWAKKQLNVDSGDLPQFLMPPPIDLSQMPFGSFYIQLKFKLLKPYISRDDNQFYIVDNPIVRDKVFRLPLVRATAWKGSLRHALWQLSHQEDNEQIQWLFGTANDEKPEQGKGGHLYFYPTFFTQTSLEVINPHDRERRVGKKPILMESVPIDVTATFTLLYAPLDCIGKDETETHQQTFTDLQLVAEGLQAMFTMYGFGAKTSSGFGLADESVKEGTIIVGGFSYEMETAVAATTPQAAPKPDLPRYLSAPDQLHLDFQSETGQLRSEAEYQRFIEGQGQNYAKKNKQRYAKAKGWWEREGQQLAQQSEEPEIELEPIVETPPPYPLARETFETFSDLPAKAQKLAHVLRQTGGAT